ncbi:MAG: CHAT domain-containing protein [Propionibacteriaceae bacterium]
MASTTPPETSGTSRALGRARELYEEARGDIAAYAIERATSRLDEAAAVLGDDASLDASELRLRIAMSRTWGSFARDPEGTQAELERVAVDAAGFGLDHLVPLAMLQQGVLWTRLGEHVRALAAFERIGPYEGLLTVDDHVRLLINRGTTASLLLKTEAASTDLAQAAALARDAHLDRFAYMALHNRGFVEFLRGDLPAALRLMDEADRLDAPVDRGIAHLDRGRVLIEAGLVTDAWETLQTARTSLAEAGLETEADEVELDLARCEVLLTRADDAVARVTPLIGRFAARAARFREIEARVLRAEALAFGEVPDDSTEAEALAHDAAEVDRRLGEVAGVLLAESLIRTGRAGEAPVPAVRALTSSTQLARRCLARRVAVDLALARGDEAAARRTLRAVSDDLRTARRGVSSLDLKTGMALHAFPLAVTDVALAARSGSASRVLAVTERWRTATGSMPQVRPSDDPPEQALWTMLRKLRAEQRDAAPEDIDENRRAVSRTVRALRETSWARDLGEAGDDVAASTAEIRTALAERETSLTSMAVTGQTLVAVVGRPGGRWRLVTVAAGPSVLELARQAVADLEALARVSSAVQGSALRAGITGSLTGTLAALDRALAPTIPAGRDPLLLVPPAQLAALPWAMLPSLRGRALTVSLSATHWVRHRVTVREPVVRAVAGPDLRLARAEQAAVSAAWGQPDHALSHGRDFRDGLAAADLVHVAAHGQHEPDNPLFSSLLLSDGPTFVHEVEGMRVRARHVVLSACRAGRVNVRPGDEPLGLTACLLAFGVGTVVAPVSVVGDELALATMTAYHERLSSGLDSASALAAVTGEGPLLAASFTCFGAGWKALPAVGQE